MGLGKTYSADYLIDSNGNTGVSGQVLISTATGIDWADGSSIIGGPYLPLAGGTMTGNTIHGDNVKSVYGAGNDLSIYHDGSNSYIEDSGTGGLFIRAADSLRLQGINQSNFFIATQGSSVNLYYNNANKFDTTNVGVNVTGKISLSGKITGLTAGTANTDAVNVQQLNDATTGALIFKGTWSAAPTTTSTLNGAVSSNTTIVIAAANPGISVGATITGAALPAGVTVTAIAVDEVTITMSSAHSISNGATLTFTTVGGIPDLSQTARKVTGDYYICETAGVATPNGASTTPDEWAVGDWVAFSDLATDAWQKIDNSSVLSGGGNGGSLAAWSGTGTSVTLSDSRFTQNANENTVTAPSNLSSDNGLIVQMANGNDIIRARANGIVEIPTSYLHINNSGGIYSDGKIKARGGVTDDLGTLGLGGSDTTDNLVLTSNTSAKFSGLLDVTGAADGQVRIYGGNDPGNAILEFLNESAASTEGFRIKYMNQVGDTYFDNIWDGGTDTSPAIRFRTKTAGTAVDAVTITHGGNVGIGTTSPIDKLNVDGGTGDAAAQDAKIALTRISSTGNVLAGKMVLTTKPSDTTNHGNLVFQVKTTASSGESSAYYTDAMTIDGNSANIGIGVDNPAAKLTIGPGGATTRSIEFQGNNSATGMSGTLGYFANAVYLASNYYYNSGQVHPNSAFGQLAIILISGQTAGSNSIDFDISDHTDANNAPDHRMQLFDSGDLKLNNYDSTNKTGTPTYLLGTDASGNVVKTLGTGIPGGPYLPLTAGSTVPLSGDLYISSAKIANEENTDIDVGTEVIAQVAIATFTAAFFDFVVKKGTNVRSGTVFACHDGTNVEYAETSTVDLGDTSDLVLTVDISAGNMRLLGTAASNDWSVKSLIRAI